MIVRSTTMLMIFMMFIIWQYSAAFLQKLPIQTNCREQFLVYGRSRDDVDDELSYRRLWNNAHKVLVKSAVAVSLYSTLAINAPAVAIGDLFEFKDRTMVLQDISFNVDNAKQEQLMLDALFQQKIRLIREKSSSSETKIVVGYGADFYKSPDGFFPGISDFQEDGGHATLSFVSKKASDGSGDVEIFDRGDGLQYVKMGTETIRLSKAIQEGANVQYAYGYVDLESPAQVPYEVVVGLTRDPVMFAALRVSDVPASTKFFTESMGMTQSKMPLARNPGSQYERQQPVDSVYVSYGVDSMGLLLLPSTALSPAEMKAQLDKQPATSPLQKLIPGAKSSEPIGKARSVNVGNLLQAFTIIVDDSNLEQVPAAVRDAFESAGKAGTAELASPDGYIFRLQPYSQFMKEATRSVPVP